MSSPKMPAPIDPSMFAVSLWTAPPAPVAPPKPTPAELAKLAAANPPLQAPPSPAPLRLQLVGIVRDDTDSKTVAGGPSKPILRAALYDPDTDKLHLVTDGEAIGPRTVKAVDPGAVWLVESTGATTRLTLRQEQTPSFPPLRLPSLVEPDRAPPAATGGGR